MSQESVTDLESYLARIYVDDAARARFLEDPRGQARAAGLSADEVDALLAIDVDDLLLAVHSFTHKRRRARRPSWLHSLRARLRRAR